jgi:hypothetical protein
MTVLIQLTLAGADTGPFNLYSDLDSFGVPFEVGVPKASLTAGYASTIVPDGTTTIRVCSTSLYCANCIDITLTPYCNNCTCYTIFVPVDVSQVNYIDCDGAEQSDVVSGTVQICAQNGTVNLVGDGTITSSGCCEEFVGLWVCPTTTTTTTTTTV